MLLRRPDVGPGRLVVLLLPRRLEAFGPAEAIEDLLRAPDVVAVDPPRTSYATLARIPDALGISIAAKQARRLRRRLPGVPGAVVIFEPAQYPLARGLLMQVTDAELWYGRPLAAAGVEDPRLEALHAMAARRAALLFDAREDGEALLRRRRGLAGAA